MAGMKAFVAELLPYAAMVTVECLAVGLTTLTKAAMSKGMSVYVFIVYGNGLGALILLPYILFISWKGRSPINTSLLWKFFILSLMGVTGMQNCTMIGLGYSSPTLVAALGNLVPAFTFVLAVFFRFEKLDLRNIRSLIKIFGTIVTISGALIVTLYRGPALIGNKLNDIISHWVVGGFFIVIGSSFFAIANVLQALILKENPSEMTLVTCYCFFGTIQGVIVALIAERNLNAWILTDDIEIISIVYSAVFGSIVIYGLTAWCIGKKGPFFAAMFKPLGICIAAFAGCFFLGDTLHVGSVIGAIIIVVGFYAMIWAKVTEHEKGETNNDEVPPPLSSIETPLLQSHENM